MSPHIFFQLHHHVISLDVSMSVRKNVSLDVCMKFNSYKILWLTTEPKRNVLCAHRHREPFPSHEQVMRSWAEEMTSVPNGVNVCKFCRIKFPNGKLASVMSFGNCP